MIGSGEFYRERLYPLQDGILSIVRRSGTPFYLTGGTALSRGWFGHRFTEDLDLFVNGDPCFDSHVDALFALLKGAEAEAAFRVDQERIRRSPWHLQLFVVGGSAEDPTDLKIDLVNDTAPHIGGFETDPVLGKLDNWRNILSNKIAAVFRFEPKDLADIWVIARGRFFSWTEVVREAQQKEGGVDPVVLREILRSVPGRELARVQWASTPDMDRVLSDLAVIGDDIFYGRDNSLQGKIP
jgi:hypothetical protein